MKCFSFTPADPYMNMSDEEQGYYYTMLSIVAFQTLAELGFNAGLTHFVAHEWARLRLEGGVVVGAVDAQARMRSLLRIALAWTACSAVLLIVVLGFGGAYFLASAQHIGAVAWQTPWWVLCFCLVPSSISMTMRSIAEGVDSVVISQRAALISSVFSSAAGWLALILGAGLYILPLMVGTGALISLLILSNNLKPVLRLYGFHVHTPRIRWKSDFLPHQLRMAISWICGLMMFQSFVPFIFYYRGAVEAGQAGILLQGYSLANALGMAWVVTNSPEYGRAWAAKDRSTLRMLTRKTILRSVSTVAFAAAAGLLFVALLKSFFPRYGDRIGPVAALAILFGTCMVMQAANAWTAAIRFGRREPFLWNSITGSALVILSSLALSRFGLQPIFTGFAVIMCLIVVPWVHCIFKRELEICAQPSA